MSEAKPSSGFICSECKESFDKMNDLIIHYNTVHLIVTDVSPKDESNNNSANQRSTRMTSQPIRPQEVGLSTRRKETFIETREKRASFRRDQLTTLLCRLNKLAKMENEDGLEKKISVEKQVVDWVDDLYVPLCPTCGLSFNLIRRRHHCRLCGAIMCHPCSNFIEHDQTSIRICHDCQVVLDKRTCAIDNTASIPTIAVLYSKLHERMVECEKAMPNYAKISAFFNNKDVNSSDLLGYDYEEAQELRIKLIRMAEEIDVISRKINTLGVTDATPPPDTQIQLQSKIRLAATNFLENQTLSIQSLPTPQKVEEMRDRRRKLLTESSNVIRKSVSNDEVTDE